jgi:hypothetical protein
MGELGSVFGWLCALVAAACNQAPDVATIQAAYESEAASGSNLHDKNLQILKAKCHDAASGFLCEVMFISKGDPTERLYFDIVSVDRIAETWQLKSGLCKR